MLLEWTHERAFLFVGLKSSVTELRCRVDEAQVDHFAVCSLLIENERFTQGDGSFLGTNAAAFDHDEVLFDLTVMWETTLGNTTGRCVCIQLSDGETYHRRDRLLGWIVVRGAGILDCFTVFHLNGVAHAVDLLVDFRTMMVTFLTGTRNGVRDMTWMPCTDASDLAETLVCLAR